MILRFCIPDDDRLVALLVKCKNPSPWQIGVVSIMSLDNVNEQSAGRLQEIATVCRTRRKSFEKVWKEVKV